MDNSSRGKKGISFYIVHLYAEESMQLYGKLTQTHYLINEMTDYEKFTWLLGQDNNNCIHWVSKYIFNCMEVRAQTLESIRNTK